MPPSHPFRFAAQLSSAGDDKTAKGWTDQAKKIEDLGYSTLLMPDHFGDQLAPVPALMAAADATTELRIGALVFDNDYKHPLILAKEAATIDVLSNGRLELGLGAGWMIADYEQSGIAYDPPRVRVDRFEEGLDIITGLLETDAPFSFSGTHYKVTQHHGLPRPVQSPRPPLIIGGGGKRVLGIAGRRADIVSINVNLKEGLGGPEVAVDATPEKTLEKIQWVREAAGERFDQVELNCLVGFVTFTEDRQSIFDAMAPAFGIDPVDAGHVPIALIGTMEQMEEELYWRRENYGISYISFATSSWESLGELVGRMAGK
jgi:probable F420-dependent oxidoreductase